MIGRAQLLVACGGSVALVDKWLPHVQAAAVEFAIDTPARASMWLAQCAHESAGFAAVEEMLSYRDVARIRSTWPQRLAVFRDADLQRYVKNPIGLANFVYAFRGGNGGPDSGDGWRFRGRGIFQRTFRNGYAEESNHFGFDFVNDPDAAADPDHAANIAGRYWQSRGCNELADAGNLDATSDLINLGHRTSAIGDSIGYKDRAARWDAILVTFK